MPADHASGGACGAEIAGAIGVDGVDAAWLLADTEPTRLVVPCCVSHLHRVQVVAGPAVEPVAAEAEPFAPPSPWAVPVPRVNPLLCPIRPVEAPLSVRYAPGQGPDSVAEVPPLRSINGAIFDLVRGRR